MNAEYFHARVKNQRRCVVCLKRWPQNGRFCRTCEKFSAAQREQILMLRERTVIDALEKQREHFAPPVLETPREPISTRIIGHIEFDVMFDGSVR